MIDVVSFKSAIIDSAVSGKLSSNFHATDSALDILKSLPSVSEKRKRLLSQSFDYGKLFPIPEHWTWIRLGEVSSYGDTPLKAYYKNVKGNTWILDLEDIKAGGEIIGKTRAQDKEFIGDKTVFKKGQVLYSKLRPYLKKILVADEDGVSTPELIAFDIYGGICPQYIVYWLLSSFVDRAIDKRSYGVKMPRIDTAFMVNLPIPVPPITEQKFIVERIEEIISQVGIIDTLQSQYQDNLAALKSKLIDAGIQGKLTEQLPEDGTAEELYQQIQQEKVALEKAGKIKKSKPFPPISEEEKPFDIPDSWKWVHFGDLYSFTNGTASRGTPGGSSHPVLRLADLTSGKIKTDSIRSINLSDSEFDSHQLSKNDLIIVRVNGSRERVATAYRYSGEKVISYCDHLFCGHSVSDRINPDYYAYAFATNITRAQLDPEIKTTAGQNTISQEPLKKVIIPLPPLAEQKRIVAKLEELLPLCER